MLLIGGGVSACAELTAGSDGDACERGWTLLAEHPHDTRHFTQGLLIEDGRMFESSGLYGRSALLEVDRDSGQALRATPLPDHWFGEGLARVGDRLVQLTWRAGTARVYDLDLQAVGSFGYAGEGWGLTRLDSDRGPQLVLSDGTPELRFLDPDTFTEVRRVRVTDGGRPLRWINELEAVGPLILANVWHADRVAVIDAVSGRVQSWFDFAPLRARLVWPSGEAPPENDLNGLAWDAQTGHLLVTGKRWPRLFEIQPGVCGSLEPLR